MQAGYGWSDVKRDVLLKRKQYDDETCTSKLPSDSKVIYIYAHIFYTFYIKYTSLTGFFFVHNEFENEFKIMYLYSKLVTSTWQYFSYRNEQIKLQPVLDVIQMEKRRFKSSSRIAYRPTGSYVKV